jgi:hypothetical protein
LQVLDKSHAGKIQVKIGKKWMSWWKRLRKSDWGDLEGSEILVDLRACSTSITTRSRKLSLWAHWLNLRNRNRLCLKGEVIAPTELVTFILKKIKSGSKSWYSSFPFFKSRLHAWLMLEKRILGGERWSSSVNVTLVWEQMSPK